MSNMKCPFCKEEIISDVCCMFDKKTKDYINGKQIYKCNKCSWYGNKELWQELIRTRKALDVAVDILKEIDKTRCAVDANLYAVNHKLLNAGNVFCWTTPDEIHNAIEQITALEQKDVK